MGLRGISFSTKFSHHGFNHRVRWVALYHLVCQSMIIYEHFLGILHSLKESPFPGSDSCRKIRWSLLPQQAHYRCCYIFFWRQDIQLSINYCRSRGRKSKVKIVYSSGVSRDFHPGSTSSLGMGSRRNIQKDGSDRLCRLLSGMSYL